MEEQREGDRIERDAAGIAAAAEDAGRQRHEEVDALSHVASIDERMAALAAERAGEQRKADEAHRAIVEDEHRIADLDRDLHEALGGQAGHEAPPPPAPPPPAPTPPVGGGSALPGGPPSRSPTGAGGPPTPSTPPPHRPVG